MGLKYEPACLLHENDVPDCMASAAKGFCCWNANGLCCPGGMPPPPPWLRGLGFKGARPFPVPEGRIFIELMTSDRKLKASQHEGCTGPNLGHGEREAGARIGRYPLSMRHLGRCPLSMRRRLVPPCLVR